MSGSRGVNCTVSQGQRPSKVVHVLRRKMWCVKHTGHYIQQAHEGAWTFCFILLTMPLARACSRHASCDCSLIEVAPWLPVFLNTVLNIIGLWCNILRTCSIFLCNPARSRLHCLSKNLNLQSRWCDDLIRGLERANRFSDESQWYKKCFSSVFTEL